MYSSLIIPSPLGDLIAVASESHLLMLAFADSKALEKKVSVIVRDFSVPVKNDVAIHAGEKISRLRLTSPLEMTGILDRFPSTSSGQAQPRDDGNNKVLSKTQQELREYFAGTRRSFTIPLAPRGTDFQQKAWKALESIPYGETRSYQEEATLIGNPKAVRAIGGANNQNPIVIIIPCHRVIGKSGQLVGYGGGLDRKIWLLEHENTKKSQ